MSFSILVRLDGNTVGTPFMHDRQHNLIRWSWERASRRDNNHMH
jgi:hypothetical protein